MHGAQGPGAVRWAPPSPPKKWPRRPPAAVIEPHDGARATRREAPEEEEETTSPPGTCGTRDSSRWTVRRRPTASEESRGPQWARECGWPRGFTTGLPRLSRGGGGPRGDPVGGVRAHSACAQPGGAGEGSSPGAPPRLRSLLLHRRSSPPSQATGLPQCVQPCAPWRAENRGGGRPEPIPGCPVPYAVTQATKTAPGCSADPSLRRHSTCS